MILFNKYTLLLLLIISLCFNYYEFFIQDEDYTQEYESQIDSLELKVNNLTTHNITLNTEILVLKRKSDSLGVQVINLEDKRKSIIRSYEIYLQKITNLDDSELESWILSRYKNKLTQ